MVTQAACVAITAPFLAVTYGELTFAHLPPHHGYKYVNMNM